MCTSQHMATEQHSYHIIPAYAATEIHQGLPLKPLRCHTREENGNTSTSTVLTMDGRDTRWQLFCCLLERITIFHSLPLCSLSKHTSSSCTIQCTTNRGYETPSATNIKEAEENRAATPGDSHLQQWCLHIVRHNVHVLNLFAVVAVK